MGRPIERSPRFHSTKALEQQRARERAIVEVLIKSLEEASAIVVASFRRQLGELLARLDSDDPAGPRRRRLGQPRRCAICRLEGTRNVALLPSGHSQEEHRRWKAGRRVIDRDGDGDGAGDRDRDRGRLRASRLSAAR